MMVAAEIDSDRSDDYGPRLAAQHVAKLRSSAISADVATRRGYYSATKKREIKNLGFSDSQLLAPALVIPVYGPGGEVAYHIIRPDHPRRAAGTGREVKYETMRGATATIDVPPAIDRKLLHRTDVALVLTEGPLKADAAVSQGLLAVGIAGVSAWRTGSRAGTQGALEAWDAIPVRGRRVTIAFDGDIVRNPNVHREAVRLARVLIGKGAIVDFALLPQGPNGEKTGLDDFFAAGKSVNDFWSVVSDELPHAPLSKEDEAAHPYTEADGGIHHRMRTRDGVVPVKLSNFTARIASQAHLDDGAERWVVFDVVAALKGRDARFTLPAMKFESMGWVTDQLGGEAIVSPGQMTIGHLRAAIKHLSTPIATRHAYAHTGWTSMLGGLAVFLHGAGAIGQDGTVSDVDCELGELQGYALPAPPEGTTLQAAARASLRFLDAGPLKITAPIFGATYRAPLGNVDGSVHVAGPTGTFKSQLAALSQQHFGAEMDATHLPGSWESTENALEARAFTLKDAIFVIDDFVPRGSSLDQQRLQGKAARVFRAQGNRSGRQRMRADGSLRPDRPPRGMILSTGEDVPRGTSILARTFVVDVGTGDVDRARLTACQADAAAGLYAQAMAGYVRWLAPRLGMVRERQDSIRRQIRDAATTSGSHARTPGLVADLATGLGWFLRFAVDVGAVAVGEAEELFADSWRALGAQAAAQASHVEASDPVRRYLELLAAALSSGRAHLVDETSGAKPLDPKRHGWHEVGGLVSWQAQGLQVGWVRSGNQGHAEVYLLDPDAALAAVSAIASLHGEPFALSRDTIARRLYDRGHLAKIELREDGARRYHARECIAALGGARRGVLHLKAEALYPQETGPTGPDSEKARPALAISWSGLWSGSENRTTNRTSAEPADDAGAAAESAAGSVSGPVPKTGPPTGPRNQEATPADFGDRSGWSGFPGQDDSESATSLPPRRAEGF